MVDSARPTTCSSPRCVKIRSSSAWTLVNAGSDMAQLAPMVEQVEDRLGCAPDQWLVDGGFPAHAQIDAVAHKTDVYAPVPDSKPKKAKASIKDRSREAAI